MKRETRFLLQQLTRDFYRQTASDFSSTRQHPWPGWQKVVDFWFESRPEKLNREIPRVLDLGCGNARFATFLASRQVEFEYVGIDTDSSLLSIAARRLAHLEGTSLRNWALVRSDLTASENPPLRPSRFDLVVGFGVYHHIPGAKARVSFVENTAALLKHGGLAALALWRFEGSSRFQRLRVPWNDQTVPSKIKNIAHDIDAGDHLLGWRRRPGLLRYCHSVRENELEAVAGLSTIELIKAFDCDGPSGRENRYLLLRRVP